MEPRQKAFRSFAPIRELIQSTPMSNFPDSVEELLIVDTPERVELHFPLASLGNRFLACAVDHAIQVAAAALVLVLGYHLNAGIHAIGLSLWGADDPDSRLSSIWQSWNGISVWVTAIGILLIFLVFFGYFILFEALWSGQTPGKRWMRLRVIQQDGRPITFFSAMTRNLIRLADMVVPPFYSVGLLTIFASRHSKRLGDYVAGTVVIKEWESFAPGFDEIFTDELRDPARRRETDGLDFVGDVGLITSAEILAVEAYLRRRYQLPLAPRQWLAWRVATPLLEKMRPRFDPTVFTYERFLEELLARYHETNRFRDM